MARLQGRASVELIALVRAVNLTKKFRSGSADLVVLDGLNLEVAAGEMVAIMGESGAGKTTLLQILGTLDRPTSGDVYYQEKALSGCKLEELEALRNQGIGFVWQFHYLLPEFSALENASLPLRIRGLGAAEAEQRGAEMLAEVGRAERKQHRTGARSAGEQQRVALARAVVGRPSLLLADEPTGNLDAKTGDTVFRWIEQLHHRHHLTSIVATHNPAFARRCQRILRLENGRLWPMESQEAAQGPGGSQGPNQGT